MTTFTRAMADWENARELKRLKEGKPKPYVDRGGYCDVCGGWHKGECDPKPRWWEPVVI